MFFQFLDVIRMSSVPKFSCVRKNGGFLAFSLRAPASSYAMKLTSTDPATTCWRIRFAGEKLGHEIGLKKDTVVIKNGVSFIITGAFFKWPTLNRWVVVIPSLKLTYPPKMTPLKMIFRTSQGGIC